MKGHRSRQGIFLLLAGGLMLSLSSCASVTDPVHDRLSHIVGDGMENLTYGVNKAGTEILSIPFRIMDPKAFNGSTPAIASAKSNSESNSNTYPNSDSSAIPLSRTSDSVSASPISEIHTFANMLLQLSRRHAPPGIMFLSQVPP